MSKAAEKYYLKLPVRAYFTKSLKIEQTQYVGDSRFTWL